MPKILDHNVSVFAIYTVKVPYERRSGLSKHLNEVGIPNVCYYVTPIHRQPCYATWIPKNPYL